MMVKFIVSALIVYVCTYIGIYQAKKFELRENELIKLKNSLAFLKSKIEYTYETIQEIFTQISKSIYLHDDNIFIETVKKLEHLDINTAWREAVSEENKLKNEDKEILYMFGKLLGQTDKNGQISEIEISQSFIEKQIEKAGQEKNKNVKLYKTLGIAFGLGIVIILV